MVMPTAERKVHDRDNYLEVWNATKLHTFAYVTCNRDINVKPDSKKILNVLMYVMKYFSNMKKVQ